MSERVTDKKALGRGLATLLPKKDTTPKNVAIPTPETASEPAAAHKVPLDRIDPNPSQPRTEFDPAPLQELADSIRAHGIIQPLVVRRKGERFELVAGERRWRAARMVGLNDVPVVVQDVPDTELLEIALIENIQRADLNPIEVATALERLMKEFGLTHEDLAKRTGKDRTQITNYLRLLKLPESTKAMVADRRLSFGHAKVLLGLPTLEQQEKLAGDVLYNGLSVRQLEKMVRSILEPRDPVLDALTEQDNLDPNVRAAIEEMERVLGTRVKIKMKDEEKGKIEISYYSPDELQRLYEQIIGTSKD